MIKLYEIRRPSDLVPIATSLREVARQAIVKALPVYSPTEDEALRRAEANADSLAEDPHLRFLQYGPTLFFTICLSIESFEGKPRWHLSVSKVSPAGVPPARAHDNVVGPILKAIFGSEPCTEGPPEGAFKNVRHFFAPFTLS